MTAVKVKEAKAVRVEEQKFVGCKGRIYRVPLSQYEVTLEIEGVVVQIKVLLY